MIRFLIEIEAINDQACQVNIKTEGDPGKNRVEDNQASALARAIKLCIRESNGSKITDQIHRESASGN